MDVSSPGTTGSLLLQGSAGSQGRASQILSPEWDSRAVISPGTARPRCQGNQPAMRDRQMVVGFLFFFFSSPPGSWQKVKCPFCLVSSSPCPIAFL